MDEPVSKKVKRDFCKKVLVTGKRCSFPHQLSSEFCKRHTQNIDSFTNTPTWINLDNSPDFVSSVKTITELERGTNADIYKVMELILNTIILI